MVNRYAMFIGLLAVGCASDPVVTQLTDTSSGADSSVDGTDGTDAADASDGAESSDGTDAAEGNVDSTDGTDPGVCTPNETFCNGATVVTCNSAGSELTTTPCPSGTCAFGACTAACTPGSSTCEGDAVVTCGADGKTTKSACDAGCAEGKCKTVEPVCEANAVTCDTVGKKLLVCAADGKSATKQEDCPYGCAEGATVCSAAACDKGETRCAADDTKLVELCSEDQSEWKKAETSCKVSCKEGSCFVPSCEVGVQQCGVLGIEECNSEGTGFEVIELCKAGCTTTGEGPLCKLCKKGLKECQGNSVTECIEETEGFEATTTCSDIQACSNGACINVVVLTDAAGDDQNYLVLLKAMAACFIAKKVGSCRAIDTSDLTGPITIDDLETWFCAGEEDASFAAQFGSDATFLAVSDIIGSCSFFEVNLEDLTFEQKEVTAGKNGTQCIGYDDEGFFSNGKELVVDLCAAFTAGP